MLKHFSNLLISINLLKIIPPGKLYKVELSPDIIEL